jgi:glyoxylase I family protein
VFFRARDPLALAHWYKDQLGTTLTPTSYDRQPRFQEAGPTVFNPFPESTEYFRDAKRSWMVNFRVRDLDAVITQLRTAGIKVELDHQTVS